MSYSYPVPEQPPAVCEPCEAADEGVYNYNFTKKFRRDPGLATLHHLINSVVKLSVVDSASSTVLASATIDLLPFALGAQQIDLPALQLVPAEGLPDAVVKVRGVRQGAGMGDVEGGDGPCMGRGWERLSGLMGLAWDEVKGGDGPCMGRGWDRLRRVMVLAWGTGWAVTVRQMLRKPDPNPDLDPGRTRSLALFATDSRVSHNSSPPPPP